MKKLLAILVTLMVLPMSFAISIGDGITPDITVEEFDPLVWLCDHRVVMDDATEPGRISDDGDELVERINNYAFEGEQIQWKVLVMDKNGIEKIEDVFGTVDDEIEVNCQKAHWDNPGILESCNARIGEEILDWEDYDDDTMQYYWCTLTVETPESMPSNEYWITIEAVDLYGNSGIMAENEYWYLNPVVALFIDEDLTFEDVRPGTDSYSSTLRIGNAADSGSGVLLDMFISGTDFYDSLSSGAMCPTTNQLSLSAFRYFATNGAYSTAGDAENDAGGVLRDVDAEGYVNIEYGIGFNNPLPFYDNAEIIQAGPSPGPYYLGNVLAPGSEMALTFKLSLPEPCNGNFDSGSIFFWGEAI